MKIDLNLGPSWLTGHPYAVVLDGVFNACFSTIREAEATAIQRAYYLPDCKSRRLLPLDYAVVDRRFGTALMGAYEDGARLAG